MAVKVSDHNADSFVVFVWDDVYNDKIVIDYYRVKLETKTHYWKRMPMACGLIWPYVTYAFTLESGVRFPVSAVWKKQKCFLPIHV